MSIGELTALYSWLGLLSTKNLLQIHSFVGARSEAYNHQFLRRKANAKAITKNLPGPAFKKNVSVGGASEKSVLPD